VGGLALLAVVAHLGFRWLMTSPTFAVRTIRVEGNARAGESELLKLAGLAFGQNLLALDARAIERAVAAHPWISRVEVTRRLPATVEIRCEEHQPVAIVSMGDLYLLDDDGAPFKRVQPEDALDLPLLTGISRDDYVSRPQEAAERFARALEAMRAWEKTPVARDLPLSEVRSDPSQVALVVGDGLEVLLAEGDVAPQLARLARVRAELSRRGLVAQVVRLDNRARPSQVTVQIKSTVQVSQATAIRSERTGRHEP
jgi:cell division protein FtsQ